MSASAPRRIGVMGGSFDPVHLGHMIAAQDAREALGLDRVIFMPAAHAPLKDSAPRVSDAVRLELLRAATAGDPTLEVSTLELDRGGVSYTIDTARALRHAHPVDSIFWIIGTDQAARLAHWREIGALAALVEFIVLTRPGFALPAGAMPAGVQAHPVTAHVVEISSSEIRTRLAAGRPVHWFLPAAVADIIASRSLYR
ncbi:MAG: nicotinate (nicotinamide) nucleotide adenylyltransferase [Opitutaceae bacterium]|nr:nicotinate (nicotinamide) nucleotide adenylyltransferase [Opitutaceae bacterium]